jgi:hypothetical protein
MFKKHQFDISYCSCATFLYAKKKSYVMNHYSDFFNDLLSIGKLGNSVESIKIFIPT